LVGERDERAARSVANAINTQLLHRADLIQSLAIRGQRESELEEVINSSSFLDQEFDMGLAFVSAEGAIVASRGDIDNWEAMLETAQLPMDMEDFDPDLEVHITNAIPFFSSDNFIVIIYAKSGPLDPIAIGAFSVASIAFQPLNSAFIPGEHATAVLVDSEQQVVFSIGEGSTEHFDASHPGVAEVLLGESGAAYFPVNGSEHVTAYSAVPIVEWGVVIEEPWESVTNPLLNTTLLAPLALVPVLILWGDFQAIEDPVEGIEEINRLQRTLIHMAQKVRLAQQGLRGYIGAITAGQEDERSRLARELHDDTIQSLIALGQRVQLTRIKLAEGQLTDSSLEEIQGLNEQNIKELRRITRDLRPLYLEDLGLVAALDMLARETSKEIGTDVNFQRVGDERRLMPEIEMAFYRMAQEGLSNVIRHANATQASIVMHFDLTSTTLTISDDGQGFVIPESPAEFAPSGHYGLLGLHERAELIGANLEIHSSPDRGTQLVITLLSVKKEE
jgi:signal transduction histidine kinase